LNARLPRFARSPLFVFILFFAAINALWIVASLSRRSTLPRGSAAPGIALPAAGGQGNRVRLADLVKERPVALVFWATWCPTCRSELEALEARRGELEKGGVGLAGINMDFESPGVVEQYLRDAAIRFPVLLDDSSVSGAYGVSTLPTVYVVGTDGRICGAKVGYTSGRKILKMAGACTPR